jgi:hypothetical protein
MRPCLIHNMSCRSHAVSLPCQDHVFLKVTSQSHGTAWHGIGMRTVWYVWNSIGRPGAACGRPGCVRLLPAATRNSAKVVTRTRLAVRIFPSTTRTFTKNTELSENGRVAAWHLWINSAGERHGMCELAFNLTFQNRPWHVAHISVVSVWTLKTQESNDA